MFNVSEQRRADQVRVVLRSGWLTAIELEELRRMTDMQETDLIEGGEARSDNGYDVTMIPQPLPPSPKQLETPQELHAQQQTVKPS